MNDYQHYSVADFDQYNCLKVSKSFYFALLFILRGYLVWLMSVTNMRDRVSIIEWVYPETSLFFISLLSGCLGLFVVVLLSLRRPNAAAWVQASWPYCRAFIIIALLFDLAVNMLGYFYWHLLSITWLVSQSVIACLLITLCCKSKRLTINLREFPELIIKE